MVIFHSIPFLDMGMGHSKKHLFLQFNQPLLRITQSGCFFLSAHLSFTHRWPGEYKDYTGYTGWGKIYVLPSLTLDLATASSLRFSNI